MLHITKLLSEYVASLKFENIPEEVIEQTKIYIIDYYAASLAGYKVNKRFNAAMYEVINGMDGSEEATVLFSNRKFPVENAAFMNAIYAHGADMDDGNRKAMGHVAAHIMPAVFALAETIEVTREEIYVAINAGYEIFNRVAAAAQPGLVHRGFHSTGTAGGIACAAACAKLLRLDETKIYSAMAIAAVQASGLIIIAESGQACKPLNPANAAKTGIISAKLAAKGVEGPKYPLESTKGWFHAMTDQVEEELALQGLGESFTICESYLKPYPSCRHTHCGIECAVLLRNRLIDIYGTLDVTQITAVQLHIYKNAIQIAGQIEIPQNLEDSKFSIHYSLAVALLKGRFELEDLAVENMEDAIKDLIRRVELIEDSSMENREQGIRGSELVIIMKDGTVYSERVTIPKGDVERPLTKEEVLHKLEVCAEGLLSKEEQASIISRIYER